MMNAALNGKPYAGNLPVRFEVGGSRIGKPRRGSLLYKSAVWISAVCLLVPGVRADVVTYEQFGAKGDGKANDLPAIVAAHAAANERGLPVRAKDGATYYIGPDNLTAKIMTDTDFGTATFFIDDTVVSNRDANVFSIAPSKSPVELKGISAVRKNQRNLGVKLSGRSYVIIRNKYCRQFRRTGKGQANDGQEQMEFLLVDADGTIDPSTFVRQDFDNVTSATAYPLEDRMLTVTGGVFVTRCNRELGTRPGHFVPLAYYQRGFSVKRSNVVIDGLRHEMCDQRPYCFPYSGFLGIYVTADVTVRNALFQAHRKCGHGTYEINVGQCVRVSFVNCREITDIGDTDNWWTFGSNYCRDLLFDGCVFNRFDSHCGCHNVTIRNSRLRCIFVIGTGKLLIEDTVFGGDAMPIWWRGDFGANWDGDMVIRNCTCLLDPKRGSYLFTAGNPGTHDYGYPCRFCRNILIDGLTVVDGTPANHRAFTLYYDQSETKEADAAKAEFPYRAPETIEIRDLVTTSGVKPRFTRPFAGTSSDWFFRDTKIILDGKDYKVGKKER